jgi:Ser/Thr protein kinase RdoA (MazF antagonist)
MPATAAAWQAVGAAASQLHRLAAGIQHAVPVRAAVSEVRDWLDAAGHLSGWEDFLRRVEGGHLGSEGMVHGELNADNVRLRADGTVVLLDWDQAGVAPTVMDAAYPLVTQFVTPDLKVDEASALAFYSALVSDDPVRTFELGVLVALRYARFSDTARRLDRAAFALAQEKRLTALVRAG